jgi:integrase
MPKRRANHEGTIYRRKDGRWVAAVMLPGGRRKSYYGKTRQEVAQKLLVGMKAAQDGLPIPSEQLKVGQYLQEWLQSTKASTPSQRI